jgi:hypothetical protein
VTRTLLTSVICSLLQSIQWLKSHTTLIKIFTDGCNSIQSDWINKHTISLRLYTSPCRSCHVLSCSHQSVGCLFNSQRAKMSSSRVPQVFTVEHYLAPHPCLTFQNEFPNSPVQNKSIISHQVNSFHDTGSAQDRNHSGRPSVLRDNSLNTVHQSLLHSPWCSWENFPFRVDYIMEVYIRLQRF